MDDPALWCDRVQRSVLADIHAAAPAELRRGLGLQMEEIDGALVSVAAGEPSILVNRTLGLGVERPATPATVAMVRSRYAEAKVARYFVQVHPAARPAALADWLAAEGLAPARGWTTFTRGPEAVAEPQTTLRVERVGGDRAGVLGGMVAAGFGLSAAGAPLLAGLAGRPGWHLYLSFAGDEPAGGGTLYVSPEGIGWLGFGVTLPAFRRQGGQRALLARRARDAIAMGCTLLVTETGDPVPGDPQHSYHNIERTGFKPLYGLRNFAPAG